MTRGSITLRSGEECVQARCPLPGKRRFDSLLLSPTRSLCFDRILFGPFEESSPAAQSAIMGRDCGKAAAEPQRGYAQCGPRGGDGPLLHQRSDRKARAECAWATDDVSRGRRDAGNGGLRGEERRRGRCAACGASAEPCDGHPGGYAEENGGNPLARCLSPLLSTLSESRHTVRADEIERGHIDRYDDT